MTLLSLDLGIASYAAAAVAFLGLLLFLLPSRPETKQATGFLAAVAVSGVWAVVIAGGLFRNRDFQAWMLIADSVRSTAWIVFIAALLRARSEGSAGARIGNLLGLAALIICAITVCLTWVTDWNPAAATGKALLLALLASPLLGVLAIEQLYRNSVLQQRAVMKPLCIGVGLMFMIDVFVFSQALLLSNVSVPLWLLRGIANVAAAPLLLFAVKRQLDWGREVFVSRHIVFYTTTLIAAGLYLLAMALGGYLIAVSGGEWGAALEAGFFFFAGGVLFYALFSVSVRRRVKAFLAKHFYRNRYDYREEWLRLIETLAGSRDEAELPERSVRALAEIVESDSGELWFAGPGTGYEPYGAWQTDRIGCALPRDDVLVRFLEATRWVIDSEEYVEDPEKYSNAFAADPSRMADPALYVPLFRAGSMVGIVRLQRPAGLGKLSFEDHDLLKTAGKQVAIFLEQERAQDQLSQTRQFEAFSKLTAFLMHDLKNLIAQQELVVGNAQRFMHRPEFIRDAVRTIEGGVQRMKKVLERLQTATTNDHTSLVRVENVLQEVCAACSDRQPVPKLGGSVAGARVAVDRDRLGMAITHAIRNAQDATPADGRVDLRMGVANGQVTIEVEDTGSGMEAEFIRSKLFKPFHSTKGAKGMGVGAYQIRETLRGAGGDVDVSSAVGKGTTVRMILPLVATTGAAEPFTG